MALANLLEHPVIKPDTIGGALSIGGLLKRSNKDLGRVLAIAVLAELDDYRPWAALWLPALQHCFPTQWTAIGPTLGDGLRALLKSNGDFEQAYDSCINGLLSSQSTSKEELRITGERLLEDAVANVEQIARANAPGSTRRQ